MDSGKENNVVNSLSSSKSNRKAIVYSVGEQIMTFIVFFSPLRNGRKGKEQAGAEERPK